MAAQVISLSRRSAALGERTRTANRTHTLRRYTVCCQVAYGGTAAVHLGLLQSAQGFQQPVAMKRIREGVPQAPAFRTALRREALLGCHIRHPNVVPILDLIEADGELLLVMEYVVGETLAHLQRAAGRVPLPIVIAILGGVLRGLHAAHTARGPGDRSLGVVHRDVSPQNVLIGSDGIARIIDFGVAKATSTEETAAGFIKGKVGYLAPEQLLHDPLDARTDVFGAGIVLWETLTGQRLFPDADPVAGVLGFLASGAPLASRFNAHVTPELDALLARALEPSREDRFESAEEFAEALERAVRPSSPSEVARYLDAQVGLSLEMQRSLVSGMQAREERGEEMKSSSEQNRLEGVSFRTGEEEATMIYRRPSATRPRTQPLLSEPEEPTRICVPPRHQPAPARSSTLLPPPQAAEVSLRSLDGSREDTQPSQSRAARVRLAIASRLRAAVIGATGLLFGFSVALLVPLGAPRGSAAELKREPHIARASAAYQAPSVLTAAPPLLGSARALASAPATTLAEERSEARVQPPTRRAASAPRRRAPRPRRPVVVKAAAAVKVAAPVKAAPAVKPTRAVNATAASRCAPPFYYDGTGIKRIKLECL